MSQMAPTQPPSSPLTQALNLAHPLDLVALLYFILLVDAVNNGPYVDINRR